MNAAKEPVYREDPNIALPPVFGLFSKCKVLEQEKFMGLRSLPPKL